MILSVMRSDSDIGKNPMSIKNFLKTLSTQRTLILKLLLNIRLLQSSNTETISDINIL